MKPISCLATAFLLAGPASLCQAQVGHTATSIEGLVAESVVVVRAQVTDVVRNPVKGREWREAVTLKVTETLKGPPEGSLKFVHYYSFDSNIFGAWKDAGREHLYFFASNDHDPKHAKPNDFAARYPLTLTRVVRLGPIVPAEKNYGPPGQGLWPLPLFTLDLKVIGEPEALLTATRAAALEGRGREKAEMHRLDVPHVVMSKTGQVGDANALFLPVDQHLEDLARRIIRSPGDYITPADFRPAIDDASRKNNANWLRISRDLLRAEAVKALRHFKSDENIALLKPLLNDPATLKGTQFDGEKQIKLGREYYIRKAAYETLRDWGVPVAEPVLREKPERP
jgi:hypothetical protein